jgi:pimeloyl-ACP methyl ester carboxylesterase
VPSTRLPAFAIIATLCLLVAACDDGGDPSPTATIADTPAPSPTPEGRFAFGACAFDPPAGQVEGETLVCGTLTVPEDRSDPAAGRIELPVAVLRSTAPDGEKAGDPLIYLSGGPGGPAIGFDITIFTEEHAQAVQSKRDIVFFDQRGVGRAKPALDCKELTRPSYLFAEDADPFVRALTGCRDRLRTQGVKLEAYNSAASAADIAALASALGYERYNLYGLSYGTRLALTAARDHPDRVRSIVLDSTLPLQANFYIDQPGLFDGQLQALFDACSADATCRSFAPNLSATLAATIRELNADPVFVDVVDLETREEYAVAVDGDDFLSLLFEAMYVTELLPELPAAIVETSRGDTSFMSLIASLSSLQRQTTAYGMYLSVMCREELPFNPPEALAAAEGPLADEINADGERALRVLRQSCEVWQVPPAAPRENEPLTSDVPALVLAGQLDPVTPPDYGRMAVSTLGRSTFLLFPATGHGVVTRECAMRITAAFLDQPESSPDSACLSEIPPISFARP